MWQIITVLCLVSVVSPGHFVQIKGNENNDTAAKDGNEKVMQGGLENFMFVRSEDLGNVRSLPTVMPIRTDNRLSSSSSSEEHHHRRRGLKTVQLRKRKNHGKPANSEESHQELHAHSDEKRFFVPVGWGRVPIAIGLPSNWGNYGNKK